MTIIPLLLWLPIKFCIELNSHKINTCLFIPSKNEHVPRSTSELQKGQTTLYSLSTARWGFAISFSQARLWTTTLARQFFSTRSRL